MQEGTKKTVIWETNSEPPRNYIWIKNNRIAYEYDWDIREWVPSKSIPSGGSTVTIKTTAEWNADPEYIPAQGEIIVYSDYKQIEKDGELVDVPGIKIGSGSTNVQDLSFVGEGALPDGWEEHVNDTTIHTNSSEKAAWADKVSIDVSEVDSEKLIFV